MADPIAQRRIDGVYPQAQKGLCMVRTKVPGGVLSAGQACALADAAEGYGAPAVHLTTRMSVELHGVAAADIDAVIERLARGGLTTRGACGGAVRGVAVSTPLADRAPLARRLAERIHRHFTGNPEFEGLPKKFKVGVDAGYDGARHRIQDVGLVLASVDGPEPRWDVWLAGGLGREPAEAFRFERKVPESAVVPIVEAAVRVYRAGVAPGRRLKALAREAGAEGLARRVREELRPEATARPPSPPVPPPANRWVVVPVVAGQLPATSLRTLAELSGRFGDARLVLTPDQDVAVPVPDGGARAALEAALAEAGVPLEIPGPRVLRVCPGAHECLKGLAPTRDVAAALARAAGPRARELSWAVSGCPNSCSQPQLARAGVVCTGRRRGADGSRQPVFSLLRGDGAGFGATTAEGLVLADLLAAVRALG